MAARTLSGTGRGRLRATMLAFFLALAVPTGVLVLHAYQQLKWEAFHQHRQLAEELSRRIDQRFSRLLAAEEARRFTDYQFLTVEGEGARGFLQRSPLSTFPVASAIPGLIGWFQVDADGGFSTPLLPRATLPEARFEPSPQTRAGRAAVEGRIRSILSANRLVSGRAPRVAVQPDAASSVSETPLSYDSADTFSEHDADLAAAGAAPASTPLAGSSGASPEPDTEQKKARVGAGNEDDLRGPPPALPQAAFDRLTRADDPSSRRKQELPGTLGRLDDLKLAVPYAVPEEAQPERSAANAGRDMPKKRAVRKEREVAVPGSQAHVERPVRQREQRAGAGGADVEETLPISTFESELDPFELSLLDSGHFVLYRKVWRDGQRYIQGALIDREPFLEGLVEATFVDTALSRMSDLVVAWQGDVLAAFTGDVDRSILSRADELTGALLYRTRLSAPLAEMELVFSVTRLPAGPGASVVLWTAGVLALVLVTGVWLMYRLGMRQLALARQQQDFVSAVSHELRTPITSIRMYAEMLREGWASEEKKRGYYEFIVQESERLSRLIANVLQLARMTRNDFPVRLQDVAIGPLVDDICTRMASQVQHAGFELEVECSETAGRYVVRVDPDAFSQCVINLVDNALKFSAGAARKSVVVGCHLDGDGFVNVTVRDYGPGVPRDQMKKIFMLFYRSEGELTRETVGTGIGLALVHQLMRAMHGRVDVRNAGPGAAFTLRLPAVQTVS